MPFAAVSEWGPAGAVGLGLVAAMHPCPLSLLAGTWLLVLSPDSAPRGIAGLAQRPSTDAHSLHPGQCAWRAGALVLGMVVALSLAASLIGGSLIHARIFSTVLPDLLRPFLPPLLIVAGVLQTGVFAASGKTRIGSATERWLASFRSPPRMFVLGMILALSFCPATAGLFFGVLIPLATTSGQPALYGLAYALGYSLPIWVVAVCLAAGLRFVPVRRFAAAITALSGWALIAIGVWLTWKMV